MFAKRKESSYARYQSTRLTFVFLVDWGMLSLNGLLFLGQVQQTIIHYTLYIYDVLLKRIKDGNILLTMPVSHHQGSHGGGGGGRVLLPETFRDDISC